MEGLQSQPRQKPGCDEDLAPYQYRALDQSSREIRLLRILPGTLDQELTLEIFHAPLIEPEGPA
ncbi:hypothetical protein K458DRAFT_139986 [Lentithecium fluviatile CBS 122367]|uniref:Uncharacterized protein n=1 Tax=Lentithecium fluviatile CBS 122367 TaxID=1168545 RepID=A0A6G1IK66_9PLEO|nr:hypothetical protein K458DRAFT_139986 [Lentithecium fluviatile CBS 122367]